MGADYYASMIVGVRVPTKKLYDKKRVKAFKHSHPEDWTVDPKTGKELWKDEETFLLADVVSDDDYWWKQGKKDYKAVAIFDQSGEDRGDNAFLGRHLKQIHVGYNDGKGEASILGVDMLAEKKFLEDLLTPHGLWSEKAFGIWLVGNVSC